MELKKQIIKENSGKSGAFSQITLEDDYVIPDSKPDVAKVIHTEGKMVFDEPRISSQALWINGRMNFTVLYRSEDEDNPLQRTEGAIPFQEKLSVDGLEETDQITIKGHIEDLAASVINSRKLALRGVADIVVSTGRQQQQEIVTGVEDEEELQIKKEEQTMLDLVYSKKDVLRVRREIDLPPSNPNIQEILFSCVDAVNIESSLEAGQVLVQGEARICVIYKGVGEDKISCFQTTEGFQGKVDNSLTDITGISWVTVEPEEMAVEAREDYDGETRIIRADLSFAVQLEVWREETVSVLTDMYALDRDIRVQHGEESLKKLLICNETKVRLGEQFTLEREQEKIARICCFSGEVNIEKTTLEENGLMVEGTLGTDILYMTEDDYLPLAGLRVYLPFEQMVEFQPAEGKVSFRLQTGIEQLQVNMLDAERFEVKAMVDLEIIAFEEIIGRGIIGVEEKPLDREALQKQPGLVGYKVALGDDLWDIAKKYHTTVQRIAESNDLQEQKPQPGQKLIIVKEMV